MPAGLVTLVGLGGCNMDLVALRWLGFAGSLFALGFDLMMGGFVGSLLVARAAISWFLGAFAFGFGCCNGLGFDWFWQFGVALLCSDCWV